MAINEIEKIRAWLQENVANIEKDGFGHWLVVDVPNLDDFTTYHQYFDHTALNNERTALYSRGSVAQLLAANTAFSYFEMFERAFRARHATIIQLYGHAAARAKAQTHSYGVFNIIKEYILQLRNVQQRS